MSLTGVTLIDTVAVLLFSKAFVDYGSERHGFLPLKEVARGYLDQEAAKPGSRMSIKEVLRTGQEVEMKALSAAQEFRKVLEATEFDRIRTMATLNSTVCA